MNRKDFKSLISITAFFSIITAILWSIIKVLGIHEGEHGEIGGLQTLTIIPTFFAAICWLFVIGALTWNVFRRFRDRCGNTTKGTLDFRDWFAIFIIPCSLIFSPLLFMDFVFGIDGRPHFDRLAIVWAPTIFIAFLSAFLMYAAGQPCLAFLLERSWFILAMRLTKRVPLLLWVVILALCAIWAFDYWQKTGLTFHHVGAAVGMLDQVERIEERTFDRLIACDSMDHPAFYSEEQSLEAEAKSLHAQAVKILDAIPPGTVIEVNHSAVGAEKQSLDLQAQAKRDERYAVLKKREVARAHAQLVSDPQVVELWRSREVLLQNIGAMDKATTTWSFVIAALHNCLLLFAGTCVVAGFTLILKAFPDKRESLPR